LGASGVTIPGTSSPAEAGPRRASAASGVTLWPPPRDGWIAIASVALIYAAHLFYGALINDAAMMVNIGAALLLGGVLLSPRLREDLLRLKGLGLPAALFALVILVALWTLTPWTPGGPHPVWAYVGVGPPALTIDKSATVMEIIKLLGLACVFLIGAAAGARDERARFAVQLTLAAGVAFGVWALIDAATASQYDSGGRRLQAHFMNANTAGLVFAILLSLAVAEFLRRLQSLAPKQKIRGSLLHFSVVVVLAACLLDTASRGAFVGFLGGLLAYLALQVRSGRLRAGRALIGSAAAAALLLVLMAAGADLFLDRLVSTGHEDTIGRLNVWRAHWQAFLTSPLFGFGLGAAETINKTLLTPDNYRALWLIRAPLNVYLQWLEEAGLVGAAPMFLCVGAIVAQTVRGHGRRSRMTGLIAGLLAVDAVVLVHGATDFGLEVTSVAAFWAWLLGLQFALAQGSSRR
jgi:O-antigen ligase